jgi:hypothetical protein
MVLDTAPAQSEGHSSNSCITLVVVLFGGGVSSLCILGCTPRGWVMASEPLCSLAGFNNMHGKGHACLRLIFGHGSAACWHSVHHYQPQSLSIRPWWSLHHRQKCCFLLSGGYGRDCHHFCSCCAWTRGPKVLAWLCQTTPMLSRES